MFRDLSKRERGEKKKNCYVAIAFTSELYAEKMDQILKDNQYMAINRLIASSEQAGFAVKAFRTFHEAENSVRAYASTSTRLSNMLQTDGFWIIKIWGEASLINGLLDKAKDFNIDALQSITSRIESIEDQNKKVYYPPLEITPPDNSCYIGIAFTFPNDLNEANRNEILLHGSNMTVNMLIRHASDDGYQVKAMSSKKLAEGDIKKHANTSKKKDLLQKEGYWILQVKGYDKEINELLSKIQGLDAKALRKLAENIEAIYDQQGNMYLAKSPTKQFKP